jgi:amidase
MELPVSAQFADDFTQYWALLADLSTSLGKVLYDRGFDAAKTDGLTQGLRRFHRRHLHRTVPAIRRLKQAPRMYAEVFARRELILTPVLARTTPELGWIGPRVPYDELMERLRQYVTYTPINNVAGTPAISLPMGRTASGLPIGVMLSAAHGDERTLLEVAFALEAEHPFPRIDA